MKTFDYVRPTTISGAIAAAAEPGAAYLSAGTNLLDLMKGGLARTDRLVDVTRLPGLDRIETLPDGGIRIGALVRNSDLAHDPDFAKSYPAVAEALLSGASAQLRNAATVGGNLLRVRDVAISTAASACKKREPGAGCDAVTAGVVARRTRLERSLHRHPSVGFLRAAGRPRRCCGNRGQNRPARGCGGGTSPAPWRHARTRKRP
jgi:CO/xanthine dehydrogenase FAD-binding subunit